MLMALLAPLAPITAQADNLKPDASAPTLQWGFEIFGDATHLVELQHQLTRSWRDSHAHVWRWRVTDDQVMQADIKRRAQHLGLSFEPAVHSGEPTHPAQFLRALDLHLSTAGSQAAQWRVSAGWGPVSLDHSRESIAWWRDLHASRWRLQAYPELLSTKWSLDYSRLRVSDGNRVFDYALRADPGWAAFANESWQLFGVVQRRVADMSSPYYWTPTFAEASAGVGLRARLQHGNWSTDSSVRELRPLNAQTVSSRRIEALVNWDLSPALRLTMTVQRGRSRAQVDPYWSNTTRLDLEWR